MTRQQLHKGCLGLVLLCGACSCLVFLAAMPGALGAGKQFGLLTDFLEIVFDHDVFDPLQIFTVVGIIVVAAVFIGGCVAVGLWIVQRLFGSSLIGEESPASASGMSSQSRAQRPPGDRPPWEV